MAKKIPEFYFTNLIELILTKNRILEIYLNIIEMGNGIFGIEAAAEYYFKKSAKNLTKSESAMILICLQNPKKLQPDNIMKNKILEEKFYQIMYTMDFIQLE